MEGRPPALLQDLQRAAGDVTAGSTGLCRQGRAPPADMWLHCRPAHVLSKVCSKDGGCTGMAEATKGRCTLEKEKAVHARLPACAPVLCDVPI